MVHSIRWHFYRLGSSDFLWVHLPHSCSPLRPNSKALMGCLKDSAGRILESVLSCSGRYTEPVPVAPAAVSPGRRAVGSPSALRVRGTGCCALVGAQSWERFGIGAKSLPSKAPEICICRLSQDPFSPGRGGPTVRRGVLRSEWPGAPRAALLSPRARALPPSPSRKPALVQILAAGETLPWSALSWLHQHLLVPQVPVTSCAGAQASFRIAQHPRGRLRSWTGV